MIGSPNLRLLGAKEANKEVRDLISKSNEISFAIAWGSWNPVSQILHEQSGKIRYGVIGTHFYQTDPKFLRVFQDSSSVKVSFQVDGGVFHPKCYFFQENEIARAIIGSSNLTMGGLCRNDEVNLLVEDHFEAPLFESIKGRIDATWHQAESITQELVKEYCSLHRRNLPRRKQLEASQRLPRREDKIPAAVLMGWDHFARQVRDEKYHKHGSRLNLLAKARKLLARSPEFAKLAKAERIALAGLKVTEDLDEDLAQYEWGIFGSMSGAARFGKTVRDAPEEISAALAEIPNTRSVSKDQYEKFVEKFSCPGLKLGSGTRLLAMKRPDCFVCVTSPNREGLAEAFGFVGGALTLESYWDLIIEPMQSSEWYQTPCPSNEDRELWDVRAAMLDAIYLQKD